MAGVFEIKLDYSVSKGSLFFFLFIIEPLEFHVKELNPNVFMNTPVTLLEFMKLSTTAAYIFNTNTTNPIQLIIQPDYQDYNSIMNIRKHSAN